MSVSLFNNLTFCQYFLFGIKLVYLEDKNKHIKL